MCPFVGFLQPGIAYLASGEGYERYFGGAERQVLLLSEELTEHGFSTGVVIYGRERSTFMKNGILWISGPRPPHLSDAIEGIKNLWRVEHSIHLMHPDVLIQRGTDAYTLVAARYCKKNRIPFVISISHDLEFSPQFKNRISLTAAIHGARMADGIVLQHDGQRKNIPDVNAKVEVIPNMVRIPNDIESSDNPKIFWIGQAREWKNPMKFVEMARKYPEYEFIMYTHGFNPPHPENLKIMGFDINASCQIKHGDILVLTSRVEGMSNVILEAWARGAAVLSLYTDPGGIIEKSKGGIVGEDLEMIMEKWYAMGNRGRRYVMENHNPEFLIQRWISFISDLA